MKLRGGRWSPYVRRQLNRFFALYGRGGRWYRDGQYAVFDFDNTTAVFDVEHQLCIYQLMTMAFAMTPERLVEVISLASPKNDYSDWTADIGAAYRRLWESYGPFNGEMLSDETQKKLQADSCWLEFAVKLRAMYAEVNRGEGPLTGCLFPLFWFTGMSESQVYRVAEACYRYFSDRPSQYICWTSPAELPSRLGTVSYTWTSGVSVTEELKTLWKTLAENGIDVWVCSASGTVPVQAAIDFFGLRPYCTGMTGMNLKKDADGLFLNEYDHAGGWYLREDGGWQQDGSVLSALPQLSGKSTVIEEGPVRRYGCGPTVGFMDSAGDFFFCTEFASMKLALIFNRACFQEGDAALVLAQTALVQRKRRLSPLRAAQTGDTLYLLQGRNENGLRSLRPGAASRRIGQLIPGRFADAVSRCTLRAMKRSRAQTADLMEGRLPAAIKAGFSGYHSR